MAIKFGVSQTSNPTPSRINLWVRVFTVAAAIFMAWMATASVIGPNSKDVINQILGLLLGLTNGLAPLFGVDLNGKGGKVNVDNVSSMEETAKVDLSKFPDTSTIPKNDKLD